eukprot:759443-Hanusia_phi.AAC.2
MHREPAQERARQRSLASSRSMSSGQASHVLAAAMCCCEFRAIELSHSPRLRALEHLPATGAVSLVVQLPANRVREDWASADAGPVVKLFELDLVGDGEDAQIHLRATRSWRYAVGAFVEDHERRSVVEQACKCCNGRVERRGEERRGGEGRGGERKEREGRGGERTKFPPIFCFCPGLRSFCQSLVSSSLGRMT